jgi:hypothetical protein
MVTVDAATVLRGGDGQESVTMVTLCVRACVCVWTRKEKKMNVVASDSVVKVSEKLSAIAETDRESERGFLLPWGLTNEWHWLDLTGRLDERGGWCG